MKLRWPIRKAPPAAAVPRARRWKLKVVLLLSLAGMLLYLNSNSFSNTVRHRVIASLEDATGGKVELARFNWSLYRLEIEANDLTIHGLEPAGEAPYFHVDRLLARMQIWSLLGRRIGLRYLLLEHPTVHLMVFPDGSTNQPTPKAALAADSATQMLFDLRVGRSEVRQGEVLFNDQKTPLSVTADDFVFQMGHHFASSTYNGALAVGTLHSVLPGVRPFDSSASLVFSLRHGEFEARKFEWAMEGSHLQLQGKLNDFQHPVVQATYSATLDLKQAGELLNTQLLQGGKADSQGQATYRSHEWSVNGHLGLKDAASTLAFLRLNNVSGGADFTLSQERIRIENIFARALDGSVNGNAQMQSPWSAAPAAGKKGAGPAAEVHLKVHGVQLPAFSHAFDTAAIQPEPLHLAGTASGQLDLVWSGAPSHLRTDFDLGVTAPQSVAAGQRPLNGSVRGSYDGAASWLKFTDSSLATALTQVNADGVLGERGTQLGISVNSDDLSELRLVLTALRIGNTWLPADMQGRGNFKGSVSGSTRSPLWSGHMEVAQFHATLPANVWHMGGGQSAVRAIPLAWDVLSTEAELSPDHLKLARGRLQKDVSQLEFDLNAKLQDYGFHEDQPLSLRMAVKNEPVQEIQKLAGSDLPLAGRVSMNLNLQGPMRAPTGGGDIRLVDGVFYGQPVSQARADFQLEERGLRFEHVLIEQPGGSRTSGTAAYFYDQDGFAFDLTGDGFDLADFPQIQTVKTQIDGKANFHARGNGTLKQPVVNADVHLRDLRFNGEEVGTLDAAATTIGRNLDLKARSHFQNASAVIDGTVRLEEPYLSDLKMQLSDVDVDPLIRAYTNGKLRGSSAIAGTVSVKGPLQRSKELQVTANFGQTLFDVEGIKLRNEGPVRLSLSGQIAQIEQLRVVGEDTDFSCSGSVDLRGERPVDLRSDGRMNLKLLQSFNPDIASYGQASASVRVLGTVARPRFTGQARIVNAGISFIDLPNGLSGINGTMVFNQDRLQIENLTARTGGGDLRLGGYVTYTNGLYFNVTATGQDVRLRYPPGLSTVATADLRFAGTTRNSLLSGDVVVTRFGQNPRFDFVEYLARSSQTAMVPNPDSPLTNLRLDVHVTSSPELQVQTSLARLSGDADLRIRGTFVRPVVLGRVNINEGDIVFNGTKYHLERGDVTFTNPVHIEPVVDLEATARVRDIDITLGFHGPTDKMATTYRSDPPLPTSDIIALLALGRTREESPTTTAQSQNYTETASNAILSEALNATISNRVQKIFGVNRIKIDPQVGGPENNPNARLTIEQQVSDKATLTYITNLSQSAQQVIQVEFIINKFVSVVAVRDQNGVLSLQAKYRQRLK